MDILSIARWYVSQGLSVIPVKADGSKSPSINGWRKYSNELPTDEQLVEWFGGTKVVGIGVPCGPASGNLVVLDFEHVGESAYFEWIQRLPAELRTFAESLPTVITPSGGRHLWIRLAEPQPGAKLARYAGGKTKIEIRGEGHQVLAPGCPAECHATKKLYEWASDPAFVELDAEAFGTLAEWAAACNEYTAPEQPRDRDIRSGSPAGEDSPGNDFNRRGSWNETGLFDSGWTWARKIDGEKGFLTRPGKETGISASVGMVSSKELGYPYLYVWSTSTDFTAETPYSKFAVFAQLKHAGSFSEAAKDLARLGYGERLTKRDRHKVDLSGFSMKFGTPDGEPVYPFRDLTPDDGKEIPEGDTPESRGFKWSSELNGQPEDREWIWKGYIAPGDVTLFSALFKAGKTTLLSHLLKSLDGSQSQFLGQEVKPSRVLYVTEEAEHHWARRRDALMIGNHVGWQCQPFRARPNMAEWKKWMNETMEKVRKNRFDLVVIDTLSKMWPVREENNAGEVDEALLPLWSITKDSGAAVLLIHHARKSGGEQFVSARGSGALSGFVDLVMEFSRASDNQKDTRRVLKAVGRNGDDIPASVMCELRNGQYVGLGDPDDPQVRTAGTGPAWKGILRTVLDNYPDGWATYEQLQVALKEANGGKGVRKADLIAAIGGWYEDGEVERQGEGKGSSPYQFRTLK